MVARIGHVMLGAAVGQIEVVGLCRILCRQGIDLFHHRQDAMLLAELTHQHRATLRIPIQANRTSDLEVGETLDLSRADQLWIDAPTLNSLHIEGVQLLGGLHDVVQLLQEPTVNHRQLMNLIHRITGTEGFRDHEDTAIRRLMQCLVDVGDHQLLVFHKAVHTLPNHTQAFLQRLLEGTTDRHHLTNRLHAGA